jgi:hypothetical protein
MGRWTGWILAWAVLVAATTLMHGAFWMGAAKDGGVASSEWVRRVFNLVYLPSVPVSLATMVGLDIWGPRPLWHAALLHGVGWGLTFLGLGGALRVWRRFRRVDVEAVSQGEKRKTDMSRRRVLVDAGFGLAGVGVVGVTGAGACLTPWDFRVVKYRVALKGLPRGLEGLRVVQVSDTHLGPRVPADYIRRVVSAAVGLRADVYVLSGDYVHNGAGHNELAASLFVPIAETGAAVVGVLGNHDWYGDGEDMRRRLTGIGVRMIDNDRVYLNGAKRLVEEDDGSSVCLAGFGDLKAATVEPQRALSGVAEGTVRVVVSHNPDTAELAAVLAGPRVDLMIAGHYHGGQVRLPVLGYLPFIHSPHGSKYFGGVVRGPKFPVVVSRGLGMSIVPVRIGVAPEIVEITLVGEEWSA